MCLIILLSTNFSQLQPILKSLIIFAANIQKMAKITYNISTKINHKGESEIIMNIQPQRGLHYRLKTGVFTTAEQFTRLIKADRVTTLDYLSTLEARLYEAFPCTKEKAEEILGVIRNTDDILSSYRNFYLSRITEKGLTSGTQELYHSVEVLLKEYTGNPTSIKAITTQFLGGIIQFMTEKGLTNTTQLNYWRVIKVYLSHLVENSLLDQKILMYKPTFRQADNDVIYLSHNELYRLFMLDLSDNRKYEKIRDCFVVQCLTGLRHSDLTNITKERIQEDANGKYISLLTKKTTQRLKIYLNSTCCEILEKYDWTLPVADRDTNNHILPKIAKMAGIDGDVEVVRFVGSKRVVEHKRKHEMIRSHTARRTFICQAIEAGISTTVIQSITGHRQLSSFERYVGIADKSKAKVGGLLEL